jgi:hypothetical protein
MLIGKAPATEAERQELASLWGIDWPNWPHWPWTTRIRILVVIDGRITKGSGRSEFGLGLALQTLRDISFAYWVRFLVTVEDRDTGFRFTNAGFDIGRYDQVWFFGDWPGIDANRVGVPDSIIEKEAYGPMQPAELQIIAAWMNNGGGVFAAGDHTLLGASMCHKIPRVRSMRKWTHAQGVPSFEGPDRHETLVDVPDADSLEDMEHDQYPQRIFPVFRRDSDWPLVFGHWPHPILCGKDGVIGHFPDHMHEGAVVEDNDVVVTDKLLPGAATDEYPIIPIVVDPGATAGPPIGGDPSDINRPRPQVIAHGLTTHRPAVLEESIIGGHSPPVRATPTRFAMIGVYDGDPVEVGRVVVDSTWHHWFSYNLVGLRDLAPGYYRNMQSYYRNIGLWLATPAQRASMLVWATWGALVGSQPGLFDPALGVYGMGERAVDVIGRTAPQCIVSELVGVLIRDRLATANAHFRSTTPWEPALRPPVAMINRAIVGGIAIGMFDLVKHHITERARGRTPDIAPEEIRARGIEGIAIGTRELQATLATAAERFGFLATEPLDERYADLVDRIQVGNRVFDEQDVEPER